MLSVILALILSKCPSPPKLFELLLWVLTICKENLVILGRIQMERFIPAECCRKKSNTRLGIFSLLYRNDRNVLYHLFGLPVLVLESGKQKMYRYFVNDTTQPHSFFKCEKKIQVPFEQNFSLKFPYKWQVLYNSTFYLLRFYIIVWMVRNH